MTVFKSSVTINKPVDNVYRFLADLNNHKLLMPSDIEDWTYDNYTATFNVRNMGKISLVITDRKENQEIIINTIGSHPLDLGLKWNLLADDKNTVVIYTITADLNKMMKMIASGHLQKLADSETQNLYNVFAY